MAEQILARPRRAEAADLPGLARMLTRAFLDDPVVVWSCRSDRLRPRVLERIFGMRLRDLHAHGEIWTTDDLASAAVWAPPDRWRTTTRQDIVYASTLLHPRLVLRMPMVVRGLLGIEAMHPEQPPHWYLAILGTDPSAQGRGLGSAMMAPILEDCDRDGIPIYLETSKERNIAFYARHGFRVTGERRLPRGPLVWPMWRDPRG
jgi:ribosomal protein S18 acetylase RimI-like enzyme